MAYFVTGATGFIGRHLVERLLQREGDVHLLVRPESIGRLDALIHRWGGAGRIRPVLGDLSKPLLGLDPERVAELRGSIDHFFKLIQRLGGSVPSFVPLVAPELGDTNIVPVDYVAAAMDHIAHQPGLDGRAFHLVSPRSHRSAEVVNAFARAAGAPRIAVQLDDELTLGVAGAARSLAMRLPGARAVRRSALAQVGIPDEVVDHVALIPQFATEETERALDGSGIEVPELETYAPVLWEYWEANLDPDQFNVDSSLANAVNGKTVLITGASSGIGRAAAIKLARAGGIPLLVARSADKLEEVRDEIVQFGGSAHVYTADVSDPESIDQLVAQVLSDHPAVDVLVNNAGRSIRRSIALSYHRYHDFERTIQLNYLGAVKLILALLPHMRARKSGHVVNISSIGVQTSPPRFSAYVASKAALDAFTRVVGSETIADRVTFTTIHMPLVRTPMIAPTKLYNSFPTISPEEAADLICDAIRKKPKQINTRLGTFGEVAYALAPRAVDQLLHLAYRVFPDSAAAKGTVGGDEAVSREQLALAHLTRGVHW
jgi:NAD(P)-dependent dehydrogenase (short-subunit alcohol dehydrogenase family)